MSREDDEAEALAARALALEAEIEAARERIRGLQGIAKPTKVGGWRRVLSVEARRDLPGLDLPEAHEVLVDALHRETGMVGAVTIHDDQLEWRPMSRGAGRAAHGLRVQLEGSVDASSLEIQGPALSSPWAASSFVAATLLPVLLVLAVAAADLGIAWVAGAPFVGLLVSLPLGHLLARRISAHWLDSLAGTLAESLPLATTVRARVASDELPEDAEAPTTDAAIERELRRGLP